MNGVKREFPEELCSEVLTQYCYGCYGTSDYKCPVIRRYCCGSHQMIVSYYLQKAIEEGDNSVYWKKFQDFYLNEIKRFPCSSWVRQWVEELGYESIAKADVISESQKKVVNSIGICSDNRIHEVRKQFGKISAHAGIQSDGRGVTFMVGLGFKF
jgi:hypothetical protein